MESGALQVRATRSLDASWEQVAELTDNADHEALLQHLGRPIPAFQLSRKDDLTSSRSRTQSIGQSGAIGVPAGQQGRMDKDKLHALVREFIETERRYLQRLSALKSVSLLGYLEKEKANPTLRSI
jgi:hypothetical protein